MIHRLAQWSVWPVLQRELREGARRKANHRLRLLSAGVGTLVLWRVTSAARGTSAQMSGWILAGVHTWLLLLVFVMVPALTADCIARERREGTLGLLFLTPLSASGVVAGKVLARVLRTFTLWLAVVPLLTISFLGGGVNWFDAFSALSLEFCATVLCLAAGLLASTLARERGAVFTLAFVLGALFWLLFAEGIGVLLLLGWRGGAGLSAWELVRATSAILPLSGGVAGIAGVPGWSGLATLSSRLGRTWMWLCAAGPVVAVGLCWLAGWVGARTVERSWQDKVLSVRRQNWLRRYCSPMFRKRFRRRSQTCLDWNPIAWLQQYSWKARLSRLGLCLAFVAVLGASLGLQRDEREVVFRVVFLVLAGCYSFVGVNGFLEEKRSGALELLLVTPLSAGGIIFGRTWGLWKQFLPAGLVLAGFSAYPALEDLYTGGNTGAEDLVMDCVLACGFFALPVFATYFALRVKHLLVAAVLTWVALVLPPLFAAELTGCFVNSLREVEKSLVLLVLVANVGFAWLACRMLHHSLSRRIYAF